MKSLPPVPEVRWPFVIDLLATNLQENLALQQHYQHWLILYDRRCLPESIFSVQSEDVEELANDDESSEEDNPFVDGEGARIGSQVGIISSASSSS